MRTGSRTLQDILILPLSIIAAFLVVIFLPQLSILFWLVSMIFHELGHAIIYWLNAQFAIPSFAITMTFQETTSFITLGIFTILIIILGIIGAKAKNSLLFYGSIFLFTLLWVVALLVPERTIKEITLYGGLGGEIYLGALAALTYYIKFPQKFNWDKNKFLFLVLGSISFANAGVRWIKISRKQEQLPMGALLDFGAIINSDGASDGDLDKLIREFSWTSDQITNLYLNTFYITSILLILIWGLIFWINWPSSTADS